MKKKSKFYDIIPSEQRSIRNIPLPSHKRASSDTEDEDILSDQSADQDVVEADESDSSSDLPIPKKVTRPRKKLAVEEESEDIEDEDRQRREHAAAAASKTSSLHHPRPHSMDGIKVHAVPRKHPIAAKPVLPYVEEENDSHEDLIDDEGEYMHPSSDEIMHIPVTKSGKKGIPRDAAKGMENEDDDFENWRSRRSKRPTFLLGWKFITVLVLIVLGMGYYISLQFVSADIIINPTEHELKLNSETVSLSDVNYLIATTTVSTSTVVTANGVTTASKYASGQIVIYNAFSSTAQKLANNTRFETPEGLIFRLQGAVTVPGMTTSGGKTTPGSVTATIMADQPGSSYAVGLKDFNLTAYKGLPQYTKIYARSKTELALGGGSTSANISNAELSAGVTKLKASLTAIAQQQLASIALAQAVTAAKQDTDSTVSVKTSENDTRKLTHFTVPANTMNMQYATIKETLSKDQKSATLSLTATATGLAIDDNTLADVVLKDQTPADTTTDDGSATSSAASSVNGDSSASSSGDDVAAPIEDRQLYYTGDLSSLNISMSSKNLAAILKNPGQYVLASSTSASTITFSVSGTTTLRPSTLTSSEGQ